MEYFNKNLKSITLEELNKKMLLKSNILNFNNKLKDNNNYIFNNNNKFVNNNNNNKFVNNNNNNKFVNNNNNNKFDKNITSKKDSISKQDTFFYPKDKDTLFWCYYINKYGIDDYLLHKQKKFTIEHEFKINIIEKIKNIKDKLKINKIKKNSVEDELINEKKIGIETLKLFMLLDNTNVIIIKKHCYQVILINIDYKEINIENYKLIFNDNDGYYINSKVTNKELLDIINSRYKVDNLLKPLKTISSYKLNDIQYISNLLNISLFDNNSKNKTKQILYTEILDKITSNNNNNNKDNKKDNYKDNNNL